MSSLPDPIPTYPDALTAGPVRGRGAAINPANRFEDVRLHVLGEHLDEIIAEHPDGSQVTTHVFRDNSKSILNPVDSPDLHMLWTVNPYRGCEHGCIYCYARPGHEYLSLSCGVDFETKIAAKFDAAPLLRTALDKPSWQGETISISGVTDCYQPIEAKLRITRSVIELCAEYAQPVTLISKNKLITRDIDLFQELAKHHAIVAALSITTLDNKLASKMEPRASAPKERLAAVRALADAGIPVHVMVAPVLPVITESEIPAILKAVADAGASSAGYTMLRLPYQIKALFLEWLQRHFPDRAAHVESAIREMRGGELYNAAWHTRHKGQGARADQVGALFATFKKRYRLTHPFGPISNAEFLRRKAERANKGQLRLF